MPSDPHPSTTEQSPREWFWSFAFLWAPAAAFLTVLLAAAIIGRGPGVLLTCLANLALVGCLAALIHAIFRLRRSTYVGREGLLLMNGLALLVSCVVGYLLVALLVGLLMA